MLEENGDGYTDECGHRDSLSLPFRPLPLQPWHKRLEAADEDFNWRRGVLFEDDDVLMRFNPALDGIENDIDGNSSLHPASGFSHSGQHWPAAERARRVNSPF